MFKPANLPAAASAVLEQVRALPLHDLADLTPSERAEWVVALQQISDAVQAASATALDAFDANSDGHTLHAARSTAAWLRGALGVNGAEAAERVHVARGTRTFLSCSMKLLAEGAITYDHLRTIERGVRHLPNEQREPATDVLNEAAQRLDAGELRQVARHLVHVVDPDGVCKSAAQQFDRRRVHLSPLLDGMVSIDGVLDPEGAATVTAALEPFLVPIGADDERSTPQRRADGLVELARVAMSQGDIGISGGQRPQLHVLCTLEGLTSTSDRAPGHLVQTPGGGVLPPMSTRRISCDAAFSRVLLNAESIPVDLGREVRLFTPQQRRLLALRDGGCRFPGCGMPPAFTDAHHVVPWQEGGRTSLKNGALLCRMHHRMAHEGGWRIQLKHCDEFGEACADADRTLTFVHERGAGFGKLLTSEPRNLSANQLGRITWWTRPPPDSS